jgi:hypothetical protein
MQFSKLCLGSILLTFFYISCSKPVEMKQGEVPSKTILVKVVGDPKFYVWSSGGAIGTSIGVGILVGGGFGGGGVGVGTGASINLTRANAEKRGQDFEPIVADYDLKGHIAEQLIKELSNAGFQKLVRACNDSENPAKGKCSVVNDMGSLQKDFAGQQVLIVRACEYGIRSEKPYLGLSSYLYDINSKKRIVRGYSVLATKEITCKPMKPEEWKNNKELLISELDSQITKLAANIASFVKKGKGTTSSAGGTLGICDPDETSKETLNGAFAPAPGETKKQETSK